MEERGKVLLLVGLGVGVSASAGLLYYFLRRDEYTQKAFQELRSGISTSKQTSVSVRVPREMVGSIIGRQGATIKELQEKTNTRIRFDDSVPLDNETEFRTVFIRGNSSDVQEAQTLINELLYDQPKVLTEEIFIPVRACGRIIGRNGETVRSMCHQSQAKIQVDRGGNERDPDNMKRVTLRGTRQQIEAAIVLIDEKLAEEEAFRQKVALSASGRISRYSNAQKMITVGESDHTIKGKPRVVREQLNVSTHENFSDVFVSSVVDPGQFWVQLVGTKSVELDKLIEEMTDFYELESNRNLHCLSEAKVGDIVAAPYSQDDSWYRVSILEVVADEYSSNETQVTIYYVDFGETTIMNLCELCHLENRWQDFPLQAIECRLANVKGTLPGGAWMQEASEAFKELSYAAQWKVVLARPLKCPSAPGEGAYIVEIFDTKGEKDVNVGQELIQRHLALIENLENQEVRSSHHTNSVGI